MASVRPAKKGFFARYRDEYGHRVERLLPGVQTKREALREANALEERAQRVRRGLETSCVPMTLGETWAHYAKAKAGNKASLAGDRSRWKVHVGPRFGKSPLHSIRPSDIEEFLEECQRERGVSGNTAEKIRMLIAALFTYAIRKKKYFKGENPARAADKPTIVEKPREELEPEYVGAVLSAVRPRWRNMFAASVYTGCRAGELKAIRIQDVNVESEPYGVIVWRSNARDVTKGKKNRWVPIPPAAVPAFKAAIREARAIYEALPQHWQPSPGDELLFPSDKGEQLRVDVRLAEFMREALIKVGLIKHYEVSCEACETEPIFRREPGVEVCSKCLKPMTSTPKAIDVVFHSLRATAATTLQIMTGDMRHVQQQLGHKDLKTTERYIGKNRSRFAALSAGLDFSPHRFPTLSLIKPEESTLSLSEPHGQTKESQ